MIARSWSYSLDTRKSPERGLRGRGSGVILGLRKWVPGRVAEDLKRADDTMTKQEEYLIWWLPYWAGYFHEIHLARWEKRSLEIKEEA